jgi:hypothetical protein
LDLLPVLLGLIRWGLKHEPHALVPLPFRYPKRATDDQLKQEILARLKRVR